MTRAGLLPRGPAWGPPVQQDDAQPRFHRGGAPLPGECEAAPRGNRRGRARRARRGRGPVRPPHPHRLGDLRALGGCAGIVSEFLRAHPRVTASLHARRPRGESRRGGDTTSRCASASCRTRRSSPAASERSSASSSRAPTTSRGTASHRSPAHLKEHSTIALLGLVVNREWRFDDGAASAHVAVQPRFELNDAAAAIDAAEAGDGITVALSYMVAQRIADGRLAPCSGRTPRRPSRCNSSTRSRGWSRPDSRVRRFRRPAAARRAPAPPADPAARSRRAAKSRCREAGRAHLTLVGERGIADDVEPLHRRVASLFAASRRIDGGGRLAPLHPAHFRFLPVPRPPTHDRHPAPQRRRITRDRVEGAPPLRPGAHDGDLRLPRRRRRAGRARPAHVRENGRRKASRAIWRARGAGSRKPGRRSRDGYGIRAPSRPSMSRGDRI